MGSLNSAQPLVSCEPSSPIHPTRVFDSMTSLHAATTMDANEKIVVSGISGRCPNAMSIRSMKEQIYNKQDMITGNNMRFKRTADVPDRYGVIPDITQFDNGFFNLPQKEAEIMDPANRMMFEIVCEALFDAGLNLSEIANENVGIYSGNCTSEAEANFFHASKSETFAILGCSRAFIGNRLAHFLNVNGPSFCSDAACSASIYGMQHAFDDLNQGRIDYAIVFGHNLILTPNVSRQFFRLGVLSREGKCKCFDADADGYARADAAFCAIIQKAKTARRHYAEVVHCMTNCDGFKEMGITFPSTDAQKVLLDEFYQKCNIPMNKIGYLEAHGTGTRAGDPVEMKTVEDTFCKNRKDPLYVGSVKSNLGHSEGGSGLGSLLKVCLTLDSGLIPPNVHYNIPNPGIDGILNGKIKVVTEVTPMPEDKPYAAISNFGFGGANGHVLLKRPNIRKAPENIKTPRLLCVSGRIHEAVEAIFSDVNSRPLDTDFIALLNSGFNTYIPKHHYRGFALIGQSGIYSTDIIRNIDSPKDLKCFFHTNGSTKIATDMMEFQFFKEHLDDVEKIVKNDNITWDRSYLNNGKSESLDNILSTIIVQSALVKMLQLLNVKISEFAGSGIGEITAAFADGVINLEQAILAAHCIRRLLEQKQELDSNMICNELHKICKIIQRPSKWKVEEKLNGNLAEYLSKSLLKPRSPEIADENFLLIGGNAPHESNIVSLCDRNASHGVLHSIGKLYQMGYDTNLTALYAIQWPVKSGTPLVGSLIKWKHTQPWAWLVSKKTTKDIIYSEVALNNYKWQHIDGHNIDGRILFPATGYLNIAWLNYSPELDKPVVFEDVQFLRACTVPATGEIKLCLQFCKKTGTFQITEGGAMVVCGRLRFEDNIDKEWLDLPAIPEPSPEEMISKRDVYKELGLRGYYYQGQFKQIQKCDINATYGTIKWTDWIPFMDNMLQIKILQEDTRSLYVPTKISKLTIDPNRHMKIVFDEMNNFELDTEIPVYHYKELDIIRCGFIEVRGLTASSIVKRKNPNPVLESNRFIPYVANLDLRTASRVMAQIALENAYTIKIKVIELYQNVPKHLEPMLPFVQEAFNHQPLIQPEFLLLSDEQLDLGNITVANKPPAFETNCYFAIGYNLSENHELRRILLGTLKSGGFLISREPLTSKSLVTDLSILCEYTTGQERVVMMRLPENQTLPNSLNISANDFNWLEPLKAARQRKENLLLYSENEPFNGLLGLTNCLLRESGGEKIVSVLIDDLKAPKFDVTNDFYKNQLTKQLCVNVLKDNTWGSYRHLLLEDISTISTIHSFVNNTVRGDLSSLCWLQGNLSEPENYQNVGPDESRVHIYVAALNFKDVMLASGKITMDSISKDRKFHESLLGFEYSGRKDNGERVMGLWESAAMANLINVRNDYIWKVPDHWTLAEAATVPIVYITNIYGLLMRGNLRQGESILIHSATGGIGLSAINIALHFKCNIFLTVGTEEKREYILKNFPEIPENHIGNSRNTSFYELILKETGGQGVDVILNSLADEKLQTSVKCLKTKGRFIEIGKFDMNNDSPLSVELAHKEAEYHGVMVDYILGNSQNILQDIGKILVQGIQDGYIKPIPVITFERNELEKAFRHMTTGKHIGKVVIKVVEEETSRNTKPTVAKFNAKPKLYCDPKGTYIILGGLGGFGLELADLLALRGAKNLLLVSRRGITNGYQRLRIKLWNSYKCKVKTSSHDATTKEGCAALLREAQSMGDIKAVFNLAVVLRDAVVENQTEETFRESYNPKALVTIHLDELTRVMAPNLEHFVIFSSVSCGRGNAGQTNYGYSNSVMERICEKRHAEGLPGKAIQWGVVGDVGIVADYKEQNIEIVIGGTLHQRIASCLEVMDMFLLNNDPIVSSMVVAEKKSGRNEDNMVNVVLGLMQIKDIKTVSPNSTFPELGMDSMMAVEIKQTLEREFDVFLSPQELRNMNLTKLMEIANAGEETTKSSEESSPIRVQQLMSFVPAEETCNTHVVTMKTTSSPKCIYLIPGVEGNAKIFEPLVEQLSINAKCLQFPYNDVKETIKDYAIQKFEVLKRELKKGEPFIMGAHSLGVTVALETLTLLEEAGYKGRLYLLDGAPLFNKNLIDIVVTTTSEELHQVSLIVDGALASFLPLNIREELKEKMFKVKTFREKCTIAINSVTDKLGYSDEFLHSLLNHLYCRQKAELNHKFTPRTYQSQIVLCRASICSAPNMNEDYGLKSLLGENINVRQFVGDHISVLTNQDLIKLIENE